MSLPSLALLIAATLALRDATAGWARVLMAPLDPLEGVLGAAAATIAVTIGDEAITVDARALLDGARKAELVIQAILPEEITVVPPSGTPLRLDARRSGGKVALAAVFRAVETIFTVSPGGEPWRGILGALVLGFEGPVEVRPFLLETEKSAKLQACEITLPCRLIESPEIGAPPSHVWADLVDALAAAPDLADTAGLVRDLVAGAPLPDWRRLQAVLGHADAVSDALGLGPVLGGTDIVPATALTIRAASGP